MSLTRFTRYARDVKEALEARLVPIEGGPLDGQLMLSAGVMQEALAAVEVPPTDEHQAELRTPATIYLDAVCHICGEVSRVVVNLESKTTVDDKRRIIGAKVDADAAVHYCGQLPLPVAGSDSTVEGQEAFDWTIPVEQSVGDTDRLVDMLTRVGWDVDPDVVDGWTEAERDEAARYAVATHVWRTSETPDDGDGPTIPAHVATLDRLTTVSEAVIDDAPEVDPTVCPFPRCAMPADHSGGHHDEKGKPVRKRRSKAEPAAEAAGPDIDPNDSRMPADDDLLPGESDFPEGYGEGAE